MNKRSTIQRAIVLETVKGLGTHPAADEIHSCIVKNYPNISRGTVYRNLNLLSAFGEIQKVEVPGGADRFDRSTHKHYHARCTECGRVTDVDMDIIGNIDKLIKDSHGFVYESHDIVFKGVCPECNI